MFELSIVIPTRNRADSLLKAMMNLEHSAHSTYEIVVVDGASTDATNGVLMLASSIMGTRLRVVREGAGVGFGAAVNKGVAITRGRNVCVLHDDVHPLDGALDRAIEQLDAAADDHAILALLSRQNLNDDIAVREVINGTSYAATHVAGTLVADFPLARRSAFTSIGFDDGLKTSVAAADFSIRGWAAGYRVMAASTSPLDCHFTKLDQDLVGSAEMAAIIQRAGLPKTNIRFNIDTPCTLPTRDVRKAA